MFVRLKVASKARQKRAKRARGTCPALRLDLLLLLVWRLIVRPLALAGRRHGAPGRLERTLFFPPWEDPGF
eukprot:6265397-Prymnesium_polylepis.1